MAIRTPSQLAKRFRQNAVDCDELAGKQLPPEFRAVLVKTAERYRMLADKIDDPTARWQSLANSAMKPTCQSVKAVE
jgi:hypothetical protein